MKPVSEHLQNISGLVVAGVCDPGISVTVLNPWRKMFSRSRPNRPHRGRLQRAVGIFFVFLTSGLSAADLPTTRLSRGDITRWVTVPGEVKPFQQATLYAKVGGYIQSVSADIGDEVKEGQVLAEIEIPELVADQARAKADLDLAEIEFKRTSEAVKKAPDLVPQQTYDTAKGKLEVAKAVVGRNETMLGYAKVTAPFGGIITRRSVDKGTFVPAATNGSAVLQASLFVLMDTARVRLQAALPEYEAALATVGQPVKFNVEALPGKTFDATITRFSGALDSQTKTLLVESELDNAKHELRPGMYLTMKFGLETHKNAPVIPVEGLVMEKLTAVAFLYKDGKAKRTVLKIGFNDGKNVEVLEGIGPEDRILLAGAMTLTDGQPVTVKGDK